MPGLDPGSDGIAQERHGEIGVDEQMGPEVQDVRDAVGEIRHRDRAPRRSRLLPHHERAREAEPGQERPPPQRVPPPKRISMPVR